MTEYTVKFIPQNKTIRVAKGTDLLSAAARCGILLAASCGGEGLCGKCKVVIGPEEVLACEKTVESDLTVRIPEESVLDHEHINADAEDFTKGVILEKEKLVKISPLVSKIYLELTPPSDDDNTDDLERLCGALCSKVECAHISAHIANLKHLDELLRAANYKVTVVLARDEGSLRILAVEAGDTSGANYGFAFDIGTTTVVGQLIDLNKHTMLGTRIAFNKQASYGSDVITRIIYASEPKGLEELNKAVIDNINEIIEKLLLACRVNLSDVYGIVMAGNMTMMHLLLKIDPANIRKAPYVPTAVVFPSVNAAELGVGINPKGIAVFLPGVTTYIGGDIVAGILACGLAENDELALLADIGTNGEIVLGNKDWMMGAAASAGPAFEGSGLENGMKAVNGAVEKADIDEDLNVSVRTVGGERPKGICGSGYIDLLCQMLKAGIITKDGRIDSSVISPRLRNNGSTHEFVVVFKNDTAIGKDIVITEDDVENLKRSKGAIYSAIIALLDKVGKSPEELKKIYIAGGFGNYLNIENAIFIGLLPDLKRDIYEFVGNSSLAGARMSLLSQEALEKTIPIHKNITYLDLSSEPNYMDEYIAALFFPHTDMGRFPSVKL